MLSDGHGSLAVPVVAMFNRLKLCNMTKEEMRQRFFRAKNQLSDALISRGFNHTNDEEFYKAIQNVWKEMNDITPKFK